MVKGLGTKNPNSQELKNLLGNDTKLIAALQEILSTLETEDEAERIRKQIEELEEAIKAITEVKRKQEINLARNENPHSDRAMSPRSRDRSPRRRRTLPIGSTRIQQGNS